MKYKRYDLEQKAFLSADVLICRQYVFRHKTVTGLFCHLQNCKNNA